MRTEEELEELEGQEGQEKEDAKAEIKSSFDPRYREPFQGLLYLGYLTKPVEVFGHQFVIKTLTVGEKLQVNQVCKELEGTLGYARAAKAAWVGAALLTVDEQPLLVADKTVDIVRQRYQYVVNNWYDPVIELLYTEAENLDREVWRILEELDVDEEQKEKQVIVHEGAVQRTDRGAVS